MSRKFFISKCTSNDGKSTLYVLTEEVNSMLVDPQGKSICKLIGGEKKFETICRELRKVRQNEHDENESKYAEKAFSVSNLPTDTMTVDTDTSVMFLRPLSVTEMESFYKTFLKTGKYL